TKQRQHIGNYPGVTVEKKTGCIQYDGKIIEFVDLPGTYSLSAYSLEEIVSRDFVLREKPDVIIDILDSTNLERHLYLLLQFQELGVPIVGALNMSDEAEQKGIIIDKQQLEGILGIPLVKTVGNKGQGVQDLLETAVKVADGEILSNKRHLNYGTRLENAHNDIIRVLSTDPDFVKKYSMHWISIKLLENDRDAVEKVKQEHQNPDGVLLVAANWRQRIESHFGEDSEVVVSEQRYAYIRGATKETVHTKTKEGYINITEKIDRIALNRYLGIPVFLVIMFLIYQMTFALGNPVSGSIGAFFGWCSNSLENLLPSGPLLDFLTGGIINGVGGVLVFLPLVLFLFLGLSFLEDTGYMARAAFVMDK
ncbi:ferrous iron transporter B, partial [bacterium]|nr:ferrous iron transporter B [bacterium]